VSDGPAVSILLPAYDAAATLPACLATLRRQTDAAWECILVDDGSRDATPRSPRRPRATTRIRVVTRARGGIVAALGPGSTCRAPLVAHGRHLMHRDRLAIERPRSGRSRLAGVGCHVRFRAATDGLTTSAGSRHPRQAPSRRRLRRVSRPHPTLMIRRDVLLAHRYRAGRRRLRPRPPPAAGRRRIGSSTPTVAWRDGPGRSRAPPGVRPGSVVATRRSWRRASRRRRRLRALGPWRYGRGSGAPRYTASGRRRRRAPAIGTGSAAPVVAPERLAERRRGARRVSGGAEPAADPGIPSESTGWRASLVVAA
jgi:hypothetical protein